MHDSYAEGNIGQEKNYLVCSIGYSGDLRDRSGSELSKVKRDPTGYR